VTCLEKRGAFIFKVGMPRGILDADFAKKLVIPLDKNLARGTTLTGTKVVKVDANTVYLEDGVAIPFDYCCVAVGARNHSPAEPAPNIDESTVEGILGFYANVKKAIDAANSILIIGGGPVGLEIAGEIMQHHPSKSVTIVHKGPKLCDYQGALETSPAFLNMLTTAAAAKNITLKTKCFAKIDHIMSDLNENSYLSGPRYIELSDGTSIETDLIIPCIGMTPNGPSITGLPLDAAGYIKVNEFLQFDGFENIFALGDGALTDDIKLSTTAGSKKVAPMQPFGHADVVFHNICAMVAGRPLRAMKPSMVPFMVVPVGTEPKRGAVVGMPEPMHGMNEGEGLFRLGS